MRKKVQCFVDGFNLYHAIDRLGHDHLKWFDLHKLLHEFIDPNLHDIVDVFYFSAYANWLPSAAHRHKELIKALEEKGCTPIMGQFREKDRRCNNCDAVWTAHEEKETDVNIALALVKGAFRNDYDEAFLVSRDSDLTPAVKMVKEEFPEKTIKIISPPNAGHSKEMAKIVGKKKLASIKQIHLERCLLPEIIRDRETNTIIARRPQKYNPPE